MRYLFAICFTTATLLACSSDDASTPPSAYGSSPNETAVLGPDTTSAIAGSSSCVKLASGECADAKTCAADERRDVILDSSGKVATVVCYPASAAPTQLETKGDVDLGKTANNGVVAIDGANDGVDVAGNVTAAANNVVVYGEGPAVSIIGGNVDASGNNFAVRGVTIKGDVHVTGNNASLVLCVVEGNVELDGNNNVIADCAVRGSITIRGVNNVLVRNEIGKDLTITDSKNTTCDANVAWNDLNGNDVFDPGEAGGAISCSAK